MRKVGSPATGLSGLPIPPSLLYPFERSLVSNIHQKYLGLQFFPSNYNVHFQILPFNRFSNLGSRDSKKVRLTLTLDVEDIEYDNEGCKLRVKGRNIEENEFVKMGAYHTIDIEPNRKFTLAKTEWDTVALERVEVATDPSKTADVAAITMQEGTNNFFHETDQVLLKKLLSYI